MPDRAREITSVALLAVVAVGCGGGGITAEEFAEQADAICAEHRAVIEQAASEMMGGGAMPDPDAFGRFAQETVIPELTAQLDELGDLEPPGDLAEDFEDYRSKGEQVVDQLQQDPRFLTEAANFAEVNEQADAAGLSQACHIGPG